MTLDQYFDSIHRLLASNGLVFEPGAVTLRLEHPTLQRGRVEGRVVFSERTFLEIREFVRSKTAYRRVSTTPTT